MHVPAVDRGTIHTAKPRRDVPFVSIKLPFGRILVISLVKP